MCPLGFSPDGRFLACYDGKDGRSIFVVDAVAAKAIEKIATLSVNLIAFAVDVDGSGLAIAIRDDEILDDEQTLRPGFLFLPASREKFQAARRHHNVRDADSLVRNETSRHTRSSGQF